MQSLHPFILYGEEQQECLVGGEFSQLVLSSGIGTYVKIIYDNWQTMLQACIY